MHFGKITIEVDTRNFFNLPHLPSNAQGQTRRLRPHVRLKTHCGQTLHLPNLWKLTTQRRERRSNQDFGIPKPNYANAIKKKRNQAVLGLTARDSVPFKLSGDVAFAPLPTQGC